DIDYDDVHVGADALVEGVKSFREVSQVLYATRVGVAWSALGHAPQHLNLQWPMRRSVSNSANTRLNTRWFKNASLGCYPSWSRCNCIWFTWPILRQPGN